MGPIFLAAFHSFTFLMLNFSALALAQSGVPGVMWLLMLDMGLMILSALAASYCFQRAFDGKR